MDAVRLGSRTVVVATILLLSSARVAGALTIDVRPITSRFVSVFDLPGFSPEVSRSALLEVMNAAGDYWEQRILDPLTLTIEADFGRDLADNTLAAEVTLSVSGTARLAAIAFNPAFAWFVDATPFDHSEFPSPSRTTLDLGAGEITASLVFEGATGPAADRHDLFTVALHEIGHALGLDQFFDSVHQSSTITVQPPLPFAGSEIPYEHAHVPLAGTLMDFGASRGVRRLPSDIDILAVATAGGHASVRLNAAVPEPATVWLLGSTLLAIGAARRRSHPRIKCEPR